MTVIAHFPEQLASLSEHELSSRILELKDVVKESDVRPLDPPRGKKDWQPYFFDNRTYQNEVVDLPAGTAFKVFNPRGFWIYGAPGIATYLGRHGTEATLVPCPQHFPLKRFEGVLPGLKIPSWGCFLVEKGVNELWHFDLGNGFAGGLPNWDYGGEFKQYWRVDRNTSIRFVVNDDILEDNQRIDADPVRFTIEWKPLVEVYEERLRQLQSFKE